MSRSKEAVTSSRSDPLAPGSAYAAGVDADGTVGNVPDRGVVAGGTGQAEGGRRGSRCR